MGIFTSIGTTSGKYLGSVASRINPSNGENTNYKYCQSVTQHNMMTDVSWFKLVYCGWYAQNPVTSGGVSEANHAVSHDIRVGIEYPRGVFTRVTFSGSDTGTITPGNELISDPINLTIKKVKYS